jgi:hypothetical protein
MSRRVVFLAAAAVLAALSACNKKPEQAAHAPSAAAPAAQAPASATVPAATPPKRKAGQWEQTIQMAGMTQKSAFCTDPTVEDAVGWWSQQATRSMCAKQAINRRLDGAWTFESECNMGSGGTTVSKGVASGDFNSAYKVAVDTVTTGAAAPQMNGTRKMTMTATWTGPCPAGVRPGDMQLAGGMKINVLDLAKARK